MDNKFEFNSKLYSCYFELTLDLIGGKWKSVVIYYLGQHGTMRYHEIRNCMPKITERMLTKQLRELESEGFIHREIYKEIPPKVEYTLTPLGQSIIPILNQLKDWGENYYHGHSTF